ncbi:DNA-directed RNA polymerase subunit A [Naegleria gruberi]|uniref:DNA-directed RNA polymerase subunit n=1 Tax=Naegleria gruberi TaxID=5762 RepID=D2VD58_NAEGR|nr:DNA-directed RNA polymerase subunit A [Naegleria gruberi]EFC45175.1 DNA-directed RNA polymerase subunit A [Naegleria gruberi]|eukprot:XP_002677919.1 DNA-directed RNA polymerase subunit A [Naegleria gruberi strain NEG-M]
MSTVIAKSLQFKFYSDEDIEKLSVLEVDNAITHDEFQIPVRGSLYDPKMGLRDNDGPMARCETCGLVNTFCPGHFGHISIPQPVFNVLLKTDVTQVMNLCCPFCEKLHIPKEEKTILYLVLRLLDCGLPSEAMELNDKPLMFLRKYGNEQEEEPMSEEEAEEGKKKKKKKKKKLDLETEHYRFEDDYQKLVSTTLGLIQQQILKYDVSNELELHSKFLNDEIVFDLKHQIKEKIMKTHAHPPLSKIKTTGCRNCKAVRVPFAILNKDCVALHETTVVNFEFLKALKEWHGKCIHKDYADKSLFDDVDQVDTVLKKRIEKPFCLANNFHLMTTKILKETTSLFYNYLHTDEVVDMLDRVYYNGIETALNEVLFKMDINNEEEHLFDLIAGSIQDNRIRYMDSYILHSFFDNSPALMFTKKVLVMPVRFRPISPLHIAAKEEGKTMVTYVKTDIDIHYINVLKTKKLYEDIQAKLGTSTIRSDNTAIAVLRALQCYINDMLDSTSNTSSGSNRFYSSLLKKKKTSTTTLNRGMKQLMDKKAGLVRQSMMGKRVNYSARTVILPDVAIACNEVSFPAMFAKKMTFMETVTNFNINKMRELVINGAKQYPGANQIVKSGKTQSDVSSSTAVAPYTRPPLSIQLNVVKSKKQRVAMANQLQVGDVVYRHLQDGDMLLMNRQPSLHRPSILAHRARVIANQRVMRLHYASCKSFNADFDGDEMNAHFVQNPIAQSEARQLMDAQLSFCTPTSGEPLRGLIQDHVSSAVLLTMKDNFLSREDYQEILLSANIFDVNEVIRSEIPSILKPTPLWTGKQVITSLLKHVAKKNTPAGAPVFGVNLDCKTKVKGTVWGAHNEEGMVIIRDNELLTGIFDKSQVGSSKYGILHAFDECYGNNASNMLISCLSRMLTFYLHYFAISCGIDDCLLSKSAEANRIETLKNSNEACHHATASYCGLPKKKDASQYDHDKVKEFLAKHMLNPTVSKQTGEIINEKIVRKLDSTVKKSINKFTTKAINDSIPMGQYKAFPYNMLSLMTETGAKGSMVNSSQIAVCLGLQEFEGKRVNVQVKSGKTLPSFDSFDSNNIANGYVASRFLTGIKPQEFFFHCMAGRDGLIDTAVKTARSGYLQRCLIKHLEDLSVQYDGTVRNGNKTVVQFSYGGDHIDPIKTGYMTQFDFMRMNQDLLSQRYNEESAIQYTKDVKEWQEKTKNATSTIYKNDFVQIEDPWNYLGGVSDAYDKKLKKYIEATKTTTLSDTKKKFDPERIKTLAHLKYLRSLVNASDPVGIIAGQSIGEPSTQMTLNTFHFAGLDMAHVTVGIPRLVELLMRGTTRVLTMNVPVKKECAQYQVEKIYQYADSISKLPFFRVLTNMDIQEQFKFSVDVKRKQISVSLFFDMKDITEYYQISNDVFDKKVQTLLILLTARIVSPKKLMYSRMKAMLSKLASFGGTGAVADGAAPAEAEPEENKEATPMDAFMGTDTAEMMKEDSDESNVKKPKKKKKKSDSDDEDEDNDEDEEEKRSKRKKKRDEEEETQINNDEGLSGEDLFIKTFGSALGEYDEHSINAKEGVVTFTFTQKSDAGKVYIAEGIQDVLKNCFLQSVDGIENVTVVPTNDGYDLSIEGFNFYALHALPMSHELLDLNRLVTNNVNIMNDHYGIESGYGLIVKDVSYVFDMYGMEVSPAHIQLIADYLTYRGYYSSCNRFTIKNSPSTFYRSSFEQACQNLLKAAVRSETDTMVSPTARVALGTPVSVGTGSFDLLLVNK